MISAAQKKARENFKKAIEYRQKTGCSLKQAFAHITGKKTVTKKVGAVKKKAAKKKVLISPLKKSAKKKSAPKKAAKKPNLKYRGTLKSEAGKKMYKYSLGATKPNTHKDTKSHNVNIRVVSGIKKKSFVKIGSLPVYQDKDAAREISLYADNNNDLYRQQKRPILINLSKKYKKGTYKIELAAKLWRYYIDNAMQKYNKEFGSRGDKWYDLLSVSDRNLLAMEYAKETKDEFDLGNFTEQ
jgi:hypothetical protein